MSDYNIIVNTVDGAKAVELVLERLLQRANELRNDPHIVGPVMFIRLQEAIEIELDACKATKEAD